MSKVQSVFSKMFSAVFAVIFLWLSWLCLTESQLMWLFKGWVLGIAAAVIVICFGIFLIARFAAPKMGNTKYLETVLLLIGFGVYIYLQVFSAGNFYSRRGTSWDFNVVAGAAMDYVTDGTLGDHYFRMWPNNIPLYLFLILVFKPFSLLGLDLNFVGIGLNIFMIDLAFLFSYFVLKKLTKSRTAGFIGLAILYLTLPFLLYVPIYYTDTLTLPFPVLAFYFWLIAKEKLQKDGVGAAILPMILIGITTAVGGTLKLSALFILIAIILDALLHLKFRQFLALLLPALIICGILYTGLGHVCTHTATIVEGDEDDYIPKLHWIMMGLHGKGNYYDDDYQYTLSVPADERDELCWNEIVKRIKDYGFTGMLEHLHEKCAFVWAEGSYYASLKLDRSRALYSVFDEYVIYIGAKYTYMAHYCQGLELLNLVCAVVCALRMLFGKAKKEPLFALCVSMFGLFLFECMWEARSRYIFNYVPIFIIITAVQLFDLFSLPGKEKSEVNI